MAQAAVLLERHETGDQGTFGRIIAPGGFWLYSGELPWLDNASDISCILPAPDSTLVYNVVWTFSAHFRREMYLVSGTDGRAGIREHSANFMGDARKGFKKQLNGCIALGEKLGVMDGQKALLLSAPAVRRFEAYMEHKPFKLEVSWK